MMYLKSSHINRQRLDPISKIYKIKVSENFKARTGFEDLTKQKFKEGYLFAGIDVWRSYVLIKNECYDSQSYNYINIRKNERGKFLVIFHFLVNQNNSDDILLDQIMFDIMDSDEN